MTMPGAQDFQGQVAQSLRFVNSYHFDANAVATIDITADVFVNDEGLFIYYAADAGFAGDAVGVRVRSTAPAIKFCDYTLLLDGANISVPFAGSVVSGVPGSTALIDVESANPLVNDVQGTLYVFAYTGPPVTLPATRRQYIGGGAASGQVTITASSTQPLIAAPQLGTYYRIKSLGFTTVAAPPAAGRISVRNLTNHLILWSFVVPALANQTFTWTGDWETDDGLEVANGLTAGAPMTCMYEIWNV